MANPYNTTIATIKTAIHTDIFFCFVILECRTQKNIRDIKATIIPIRDNEKIRAKNIRLKMNKKRTCFEKLSE